MISENLDEYISDLKLRASVLQASNNDQKFLVINFVIAFDEHYVLTVKDH